MIITVPLCPTPSAICVRCATDYLIYYTFRPVGQ